MQVVYIWNIDCLSFVDDNIVLDCVYALGDKGQGKKNHTMRFLM